MLLQCIPTIRLLVVDSSSPSPFLLDVSSTSSNTFSRSISVKMVPHLRNCPKRDKPQLVTNKVYKWPVKLEPSNTWKSKCWCGIGIHVHDGVGVGVDDAVGVVLLSCVYCLALLWHKWALKLLLTKPYELLFSHLFIAKLVHLLKNLQNLYVLTHRLFALNFFFTLSTSSTPSYPSSSTSSTSSSSPSSPSYNFLAPARNSCGLWSNCYD